VSIKTPRGIFIVYDNIVTEIFLIFSTFVGAGLDPPASRYEGGTVKTVPYSAGFIWLLASGL